MRARGEAGVRPCCKARTDAGVMQACRDQDVGVGRGADVVNRGVALHVCTQDGPGGQRREEGPGQHVVLPSMRPTLKGAGEQR